MKSDLVSSTVLQIIRASILAGCIAAPFVACNSKPNPALCGRYYRHLLTLEERGGHPGTLAGLKTGEAKRAVLDHCMQLNKSHVECSLQADGVGSAIQCELDAEINNGGNSDSDAEPTE